MKQLEIRIIREEDGNWVVDTNLPGSPPIARYSCWEHAVGLLMYRLIHQREIWSEFVDLPAWSVVYEDETITWSKEEEGIRGG